jgi:hypothetical protein
VAEEEGGMTHSLLVLISALIAVESHGDDSAQGGRGEVGCLQISQPVLDDVNRIQGAIHFTKWDCQDRARSVVICETYLNHYATAARIGREVTDCDRARIWNAGPHGWRKTCSLAYWRKVKRALEKTEVAP